MYLLECFVLPSGKLENLGVLSLRENQLQYLPPETGNCRELHVLDVSGNRWARTRSLSPCVVFPSLS